MNEQTGEWATLIDGWVDWLAGRGRIGDQPDCLFVHLPPSTIKKFKRKYLPRLSISKDVSLWVFVDFIETFGFALWHWIFVFLISNIESIPHSTQYFIKVRTFYFEHVETWLSSSKSLYFINSLMDLVSGVLDFETNIHDCNIE